MAMACIYVNAVTMTVVVNDNLIRGSYRPAIVRRHSHLSDYHLQPTCLAWSIVAVDAE